MDSELDLAELLGILDEYDYRLDEVAAEVKGSPEELADLIDEWAEAMNEAKAGIAEWFGGADTANEEPKKAGESSEDATPPGGGSWGKSNPRLCKIGFYLDRRLWAWVQDHAAATNRPISCVLNQAVTEYRDANS